jgi:hypothetical protein
MQKKALTSHHRARESKTAQKEGESARSDAEQFKKPAEISPDHKKEVFESEAVGKKSEGTQLENNHNELPSKNTEPSLSDTSQATPVISPESFEKKENMRHRKSQQRIFRITLTHLIMRLKAPQQSSVLLTIQGKSPAGKRRLMGGQNKHAGDEKFYRAR